MRPEIYNLLVKILVQRHCATTAQHPNNCTPKQQTTLALNFTLQTKTVKVAMQFHLVSEPTSLMASWPRGLNTEAENLSV